MGGGAGGPLLAPILIQMLATGAKFSQNQITCFQLDKAVLDLYTCKILVRLDHFCIILEQFIFTTYNITYKKRQNLPPFVKIPPFTKTLITQKLLRVGSAKIIWLY